jgi:hypothetical protein
MGTSAQMCVISLNTAARHARPGNFGLQLHDFRLGNRLEHRNFDASEERLPH